MDMQIYLHPTKASEIANRNRSEPSNIIQARVERARAIQLQRYRNSRFSNNAQLTGHDIEKHCVLSPMARQRMSTIFKTNDFSGRGWSRLLKLSRTISDLDESETIQIDHLHEATAFRIGANR